MILLPPQRGVADLTVLLVAGLYLVEIGLFGHGVGHTVLVGTFEHQVFQVVGQTGGFGGVVLRTGPYGDVSLDTWFLLVHGEIHGQAIVKFVDAGLHEVAFHHLIRIILGLDAHRQQGRRKHG